MRRTAVFYRILRAVALLTVFVLLFTACAGSGGTGEDPSSGDLSETAPIEVTGDAYPLTVRDFVGNLTVLDEPPKRVAILSGAPLNLWYDLGGKAVCTVNISDNLKLPAGYEEEIRAIPSVGRVMSTNVEAIVSYEPDLVIAQENSQGEAIEWLLAHGYKVITTHLRDFTDVKATYRAFGKILGVSELAEAKIAALEGRYSDLVSRAPAEGKRVVILYLTSKKLQVKLDGSVAGIVARDLGIVNIASGIAPVEEGGENATLDMEFLALADPDLILVTSMISDNETAVRTMETHLSTNDAWKAVRAAREGKIVYLPQEYFLYNAGPYFDEAVRYMACSVYPEVYGEVSAWYGSP